MDGEKKVSDNEIEEQKAEKVQSIILKAISSEMMNAANRQRVQKRWSKRERETKNSIDITVRRTLNAYHEHDGYETL